MYLERTSSAKGPNRPPPFRPFSAVTTFDSTNNERRKLKRGAGTAKVTFSMQLQFNLSKPVLSAHFQAQKNHANSSRESQTQRGNGRPSSTNSSSSARRSPSDLPMQVNLRQTRESLMQKQSTRNLEKAGVSVVGKASLQQCRQNKQLFDEAIGVADSSFNSSQSGFLSPTLTGNLSITKAQSNSFSRESFPASYSSQQSILPTLNDSTGHSQSERYLPDYARSFDCSLHSKTNGPTLIGSPLYNKTNVSNTEGRLSTGDCTETSYNHERYRTAPPAIRKHMDNINSSYKVVTPWHSTENPPKYHILKDPAIKEHIFLIPNGEEYHFENHTQSGHLRKKVSTSAVLEETIPPKQVQNWAFNGKLNPQDPSNPGNAHAKPGYSNNVAVPEQNGVDSDKQQLSKHGVVINEPSHPDGKRNVLEAVNISKEGQGEEGSEASSSLPSKPSSAHYWLNKTWVDDVTVTSSKKSEQEVPVVEIVQERSSPSKSTPNSPRKGNAEKPGKPGRKSPENKAKNTKVEIQKKEVVAKEQPIDNSKNQVIKEVKEIQDMQENVEILNLNDLKKRRTTLPDFICPSSETKSKESAVRDWLETTSMHWAVKTSPLL